MSAILSSLKSLVAEAKPLGFSEAQGILPTAIAVVAQFPKRLVDQEIGAVEMLVVEEFQDAIHNDPEIPWVVGRIGEEFREPAMADLLVLASGRHGIGKHHSNQCPGCAQCLELSHGGRD